MITFKTTARIFGNEAFNDGHQDVQIEYTGQGYRKFIVESLKVVTPLELEPSDLYTDLALAISEDQHTVSARIECEIELTELHKNHLKKGNHGNSHKQQPTSCL